MVALKMFNFFVKQKMYLFATGFRFIKIVYNNTILKINRESGESPEQFPLL
jgi:hypothetical protein